MDGIEEVVEAAQSILDDDSFLRSCRLVIEASGELVVITGKVPSYHHKQMAQERIRPVVGNRTIKNLAEVVR